GNSSSRGKRTVRNPVSRLTRRFALGRACVPRRPAAHADSSAKLARPAARTLSRFLSRGDDIWDLPERMTQLSEPVLLISGTWGASGRLSVKALSQKGQRLPRGRDGKAGTGLTNSPPEWCRRSLLQAHGNLTDRGRSASTAADAPAAKTKEHEDVMKEIDGK